MDIYFFIACFVFIIMIIPSAKEKEKLITDTKEEEFFNKIKIIDVGYLRCDDNIIIINRKAFHNYEIKNGFRPTNGDYRIYL